MKIKIILEGKEREIVIQGMKKTHRRDFYDKIKDLDKIDKKEGVLDTDKIDAADGLLTWLEEMGLKHSDLTDEEKEKLDLEALDEISTAAREILQPSEIKKKS